jgi:hypothetical protein
MAVFGTSLVVLQGRRSALGPLLERETPPLDVDEGLRAFVREYRVSAAVASHLEIDERQQVPTALDLSLFAARPAGCGGEPEQSQAVWDRLAELARRVLPPDTRAVIEPFDGSFQMRPESGWEPEVELVVAILPRDKGPGLERVDEHARDVAARVLKELQRLGVARGAWRDRGGTPP